MNTIQPSFDVPGGDVYDHAVQTGPGRFIEYGPLTVTERTSAKTASKARLNVDVDGGPTDYRLPPDHAVGAHTAPPG